MIPDRNNEIASRRKWLKFSGRIFVGIGIGVLFFNQASCEPNASNQSPRVTNSQPPTRTATDFTNNLGMRFVSVPGLSGAQFSIWETRVQDYAAYAKANPDIDMEWQNYSHEGHPQSPDHPVVNVSWEDAVAFCEWLSRINGQIYRLPTDHEWSVAMGIGDQEDPQESPSSKDVKLSVYPWGTNWPPPKRVVNIHGEEGVGFLRKIKGYRDNFPFTASVGSFELEHHGIKDLSGNVWEWCQEWYDSQRDTRVFRGGSWEDSLKLSLRSSYRGSNAPSRRFHNVGFRCVREVDQKN